MNVSREQSFVAFVIEKINNDKKVGAALSRADNPATEYQCWECLSAFNIDLEKDFQRLPYATIAAAIAKSKVAKNGDVGIGHALAKCYEDGSNSNQAKAKLRRLLSCDSVIEVCRVLRPLFSLIKSKSTVSLDFAGVLENLLRFHWRGDQVKASWAQDFYRYSDKKTIAEEDGA